MLSLFSSCYKREQIPNTPQISLTTANLIHVKAGSDSVNFVIGYKDGDGDIGLAQSDTLAPFNVKSYYYSNLYIYYLELQNGVYVPVYNTFLNIDTIMYSYRIPILNESKKAQPIQGNISVGLRLDYQTIYKTVKFRIFLFDRALHISNIIETDPMHRGI